MCDPMSAALIVGGTALQMDAQNRAARRQQRAVNNALEQQDQLSRRAEQVALENANEYAPETRLGRFMESRNDAGDSLVRNLVAGREQQATGARSDQAAGRLSQEFTTGKAAAAADEFQRSIDMARLMGNMRGTSDMLTDESRTGADAALRGAMLGSQAGRQMRAAGPGIDAAGRPNGLQMLVGGSLTGMGASGAVRGGGSSMFNSRGPTTINT